MNGDAPTAIAGSGLSGVSADPGFLDTVLDMIRVGGPVVLILIAFSVFALAVVLIKVWQFRSARLFDRRMPRRVLALYRGGNEAGKQRVRVKRL